jgi:hypothetical protein
MPSVNSMAVFFFDLGILSSIVEVLFSGTSNLEPAI